MAQNMICGKLTWYPIDLHFQGFLPLWPYSEYWSKLMLIFQKNFKLFFNFLSRYYRNESIFDEEDGYSFTLTFTLNFPHDNDTVYLAHCYPYTYRYVLSWKRMIFHFLIYNCNILAHSTSINQVKSQLVTICYTLLKNKFNQYFLGTLAQSMTSLVEAT